MTDTPRLFEDSRDLLDALDDARVRYLIVGAHALAAHGLPRATADLDVWVEPTADNAVRVLSALVAFGARVAHHGIDEADLARPGTVYQLGLPPRRIDLLTSISSVDFPEAWNKRFEAPVEGRLLPVIGREALIANKRASGRPKDLLDIDALEAGDRET